MLDDRRTKMYYDAGAKKMLDYILFSLSDYKYKLNLYGITSAHSDLIRLREDSDLNLDKMSFKNTLTGLSFKDFYEKYERV